MELLLVHQEYVVHLPLVLCFILIAYFKTGLLQNYTTFTLMYSNYRFDYLETDFFPEKMNCYGKFDSMSFHHFTSMAGCSWRLIVLGLVEGLVIGKIGFECLVMKSCLGSFGQGLHCGCCIACLMPKVFGCFAAQGFLTHVVLVLELNCSLKVVLNLNGDLLLHLAFLI